MALFHPFQSKEASRGIYRMKWWAHQDSNLGQAGYEPAALTAELWAPGCLKFHLREMSEAFGFSKGDEASLMLWPRFVGYAHV